MKLSLIEMAALAVMGLLLVLVFVFGWQKKSLREQRDGFKAQTVALTSANASNVQAIASLKSANATWAATCSVGSPAQQNALTELARKNQDLSLQAANLSAELEAIYARDPNARAWGSTGIPASVADKLFPR